MKNAHFVEQDNGNSASFALADLSAEARKESFDVFPGDVRACGVREDCFQCLLMCSLHVQMVPEHGTECNAGCFLMPNVRVKPAPTAWRAGPDGENVQRTAGRARVTCRWCSA